MTIMLFLIPLLGFTVSLIITVLPLLYLVKRQFSNEIKSGESKEVIPYYYPEPRAKTHYTTAIFKKYGQSLKKITSNKPKTQIRSKTLQNNY